MLGAPIAERYVAITQRQPNMAEPNPQDALLFACQSNTKCGPDQGDELDRPECFSKRPSENTNGGDQIKDWSASSYR